MNETDIDTSMPFPDVADLLRYLLRIKRSRCELI